MVLFENAVGDFVRGHCTEIKNRKTILAGQSFAWSQWIIFSWYVTSFTTRTRKICKEFAYNIPNVSQKKYILETQETVNDFRKRFH